MNEDLLNLLARLREPGDNPLTDAELTTLRDGLRAYADELRDADRTDEVVTALQDTAAAVREVRTEQTTRAEAAAERERQVEEALAEITAGDDPDGDTGDGDEPAGDAPADGDTGDEPAADAPAEATDTRVPVAASARPAAPARPPLGSVRPPARSAARRTAADTGRVTATATLTAAGDLPGYSAGNEIGSLDDLGRAMARKLQSMGPKGGSVLVASLQTDYPEDRRLRVGDPGGNDRKLAAVLDDQQAITAAGGICAPVSVDYAVPVFATAERPVRDALVRFGADRGGITFTPPPTIAAAAGATGIWTSGTDASPGGATKAVLTVTCGTPTTVLVDAITTILRFGNMQGRFQPETVAANTQNAVAAAARVADTNLLNKIHGLSTEVTLTPSVGAARGTLEIIDQAIAAVRYRMRLSDQARFRAIFPRWLKDMIRADLAKELANDADRLAITDAQIDAYLSARGVNASWHLDGMAAGGGTGRTYPLQGFAAQAAGALAPWPTTVTFPIFPEGSFQFLDGGELNLGVVRDSTLNSTNDYETFIESFENVAFRGVESLQVVAALVPTGASSGTVTPANP